MNSAKKGFSVLEVVITVSIVLLLSSFLIVFNRSGERQLILLTEQAEIIAALNRAKSLSVDLFIGEGASCGFGVNFSPSENSFLIFRDLADNCMNADHKYSDTAELFEKHQLDSRTKFGDTIDDVFFVPPYLITIIDNDYMKNEGTITLKTKDDQSTAKIKITKAGLITKF